MAFTQIARFKTSDASEDAVKTALETALMSSVQKSVAGFDVKDSSIFQVISEPAEDSNLFRQIRESYGQPTETYHIALNQSALQTDGAAASPFVEYVANYFPASKITPDFQKQIEADFQKFDSIVKPLAEGDGGIAYGWCTEEVDYEGEKTKPFLILRGWRSMQDFQRLVSMEKVQKEALPILMAWNAPFKMWHIERKE